MTRSENLSAKPVGRSHFAANGNRTSMGNESRDFGLWLSCPVSTQRVLCVPRI